MTRKQTATRRADGRWRVRIELQSVDGHRRRKDIYGHTKREAETKAAAYRAKLDRGLQPSNHTVESWITYWLDHIAAHNPRVRPTTLADYRSVATNRIMPHLGRIRLDALTSADVRRMHRALEDRGLAARSIRGAHWLLSQACDAALEEGLLLRNPCSTVTAPTSAKHHDQLTLVEANRVMATVTDASDRLRLQLAFLGLRQGEVLGLRWQDVHETESSPWLDVNGSVRVVGGALVRGSVKSAASRRRVPLPEGVAASLAAARSSAVDRYVFSTKSGGPVWPASDYRRWRRLLAAAGVRAVPLHGARGTAASILHEIGVPERVISDILGHSDVRVTQDNYLRSNETQRRAALGAAFAAITDVNPSES